MYIGVGDFVPNHPNTKKLITKSVKAVLKYGPLYRIDFTGLLSNQGRKQKITTDPAIKITPQSFASMPKKFTVTARNIE